MFPRRMVRTERSGGLGGKMANVGEGAGLKIAGFTRTVWLERDDVTREDWWERPRKDPIFCR